MATSVTTTAASISNITGYRAYGSARVGENGDPWGVQEVDAGRIGTSSSTNMTWDQNTGNGFDTGWVAFTFTADAAGNGIVSTSVLGAVDDPISVVGAPFSTISSVQVRVATQIPGNSALQNITATFSRTGAANDTLSTSPTLSANTMTSAPPVAAEMILTITPVDAQRTKVVITGELRMQNTVNSLPGADDLRVQVFVFGAP